MAASRRVRAGFGNGLRNQSFNLSMAPLLLVPILSAAGLGCFWLFYKSVDFFDHI
ncbi:hypothetical protein GCM10027594_18980 [Hymenobacter agri]